MIGDHEENGMRLFRFDGIVSFDVGELIYRPLKKRLCSRQAGSVPRLLMSPSRPFR